MERSFSGHSFLQLHAVFFCYHPVGICMTFDHEAVGDDVKIVQFLFAQGYFQYPRCGMAFTKR